MEETGDQQIQRSLLPFYLCEVNTQFDVMEARTTSCFKSLFVRGRGCEARRLRYHAT
jgi:hypothetical protein